VQPALFLGSASPALAGFFGRLFSFGFLLSTFFLILRFFLLGAAGTRLGAASAALGATCTRFAPPSAALFLGAGRRRQAGPGDQARDAEPCEELLQLPFVHSITPFRKKTFPPQNRKNPALLNPGNRRGEISRRPYFHGKGTPFSRVGGKSLSRCPGMLGPPILGALNFP